MLVGYLPLCLPTRINVGKFVRKSIWKDSPPGEHFVSIASLIPDLEEFSQ